MAIHIDVTFHVSTADDAIQDNPAGAISEVITNAADLVAQFVTDTAAFNTVDDSLSVRDRNGNTIGVVDVAIRR